MDGMTGYNPDLVRADLNRFNEEITSIYNYGTEQFNIYNQGLLHAWYSPKARILSRTGGNPNDCGLFFGSWLRSDLATLQYDVIHAACEATKVIANANGANFVYDYTQLADNLYDFEPLEMAGPNGEVGMNKEVVDAVVNQYLDSCKKIEERIRNLPIDLHIYDPGDTLKATFAEKVKFTADIFATSVNAVANVVSRLKEEEQSIIDASVNQASQTLSQ